jgi:Phage tail sheath protein subtilisin-like domain/Phage tail sheath C-terminal domain
MASLTITSPGVQISETDLSLRTNLPAGTNVVVPGFAPQGPSSEPILITSTSELESIYGTPITPAERYFYYSCAEVLNSPATLTTIRLPYGSGTGEGFAAAHSALFYPMTKNGSNWKIGEPSHITLSLSAYEAIQAGDFSWGDTGSNDDLLSYDGQTINAGFVVLNDLQTAINELGEGFYIGVIDNTSLSASNPPSDYNKIKFIDSLMNQDNFQTLATASNTANLDFQLSATYVDSERGIASVSETIASVGFGGFGSNSYSDHISLGVFRLRRSTVDATVLSIVNSEKYVGSFDINRRTSSPTGGTLANSFIQDVVNNASPSIKVFINPTVSQATWYNSNTNTRNQVTVDSATQGLFPVGVYTPNATSLNTNKIIGNVDQKLQKALRLIESPENVTVDVIVDAGLSTINATTKVAGVSSFDDQYYIDVTDSNMLSLANEYWQDVTIQLVNFAENTRKDCMSIIDPLRQIFVTGNNAKTINSSGATFTENVYTPLASQANQFASNYTAIYGNWVKANDVFSGNNVWVPFSGYAAAVYARNDQVSYPWFAPAGLNRGNFNAIDIAFNPNQKQRDKLYEIAVNPVVFFSTDGYVVYGEKTLQQKPTAFDRINVRRLFLSLERSVSRTIKYFVFEPNTDFTRTRLRNTIAPIFDYAKNTQGLYDYLIVCDERNNTPSIIDQNQLIVDIYLKPVRSAEFILVNFVATTTSQNFNELI